jgi:hypothetical protein
MALRRPFVAGEAFDFNQLGDVLGTVFVPKLADDAASWSPAKEFKVDVTRAIRSTISDKAKFNGFGLRVVPDRGIDDGWTVRIQLPKEPKFTLELDVYADGVKNPVDK